MILRYRMPISAAPSAAEKEWLFTARRIVDDLHVHNADAVVLREIWRRLRRAKRPPFGTAAYRKERRLIYRAAIRAHRHNQQLFRRYGF